MRRKKCFAGTSQPVNPNQAMKTNPKALKKQLWNFRKGLQWKLKHGKSEKQLPNMSTSQSTPTRTKLNHPTNSMKLQHHLQVQL